MNQNNLYVGWKSAPEYINLNDLITRIKKNNGKPDFEFFTYDVSPDGKICNYRPLLISCNFNGNGQLDAFSLKYETTGMYTNGESGDGVLGTAKYKLANN